MTGQAKTKLYWNPQHTDTKLQAALKTLGQEYPIEPSNDGSGICFEADPTADGYRIEASGGETLVHYNLLSDALRALGAILAGLDADGQTETSVFMTMGIMLDCSRNGVMKVGHFKKWLRRLALMGYNMAMLYTEDTYELPDEPYFGYQRGSYTPDDLREVDDYADSLGIEMIPCIQALGHLEQILKWPAYSEVADDNSVLLIDEPKTYELIEKMVSHFASIYRTKKVHLGMDECWSLGLGRYVKRFGYVPGAELFCKHLGKVVDICKKQGLEPMIWSDMFFRLASNAEYNSDYDSTSAVPKEVIEKVPPELRLVYWEYNKPEVSTYVDWIARHREFGSEPIMATALALAGKLWQDKNARYKPISSAIDACRNTGIKEMFVCVWGDDGAIADIDSALAGLAFAAERAYGQSGEDSAMAGRFKAICDADIEPTHAACDINPANYSAASILWDDPLLGIYLGSARARDDQVLGTVRKQMEAVAAKLAPHTDECQAGDINHAKLTADTLAVKLALQGRLTDAYADGDIDELIEVEKDIPNLVRLLRALLDSHREMWLRHNRPQGLEVIQIRLAGQIERYGELTRRLGEYVRGPIDTIHELDANLPQAPTGSCGGTYRRLATGSCIL